MLTTFSDNRDGVVIAIHVHVTGVKDFRLTIVVRASTCAEFALKACCIVNGQFSCVISLPRY